MKVLVTEPVAREGLEMLKAHADVEVRTGLSPHELEEAVRTADGLLVRSETRVTRGVIEAGAHLRVIGRAGVGVDNIDVPAATSRGIVVVNARSGNTVSAAELTVALLLASARHVPAADASVRRGEWTRGAFMGVELRGKVAGIVGLGQIGSAVARRLRALEMTVLGCDPFVPDERARMLGVELTELKALLERADFVTLHTTLTPETKHLIGRDELALMKSGARLINTARGDLVDEVALASALDSGSLAGAALDVFQKEPPGESPLTRHPKVVVTPHLGASTTEAQERVAVDVAREMLLVLDGRPATSAVNAPFVDPDAIQVVGPYLAVAETCGRLATQLAPGRFRDVELSFDGEIGNHEVEPLKAAAVAGLLAPISEERVNLVSVNHVIAERGWNVVVRKGAAAGPYTNLVSIRLRTSAGDVAILGTLAHGRAHVVELNGFRVDVAPEQGHDHLLILENEDRPGRVGAIGTALGEMEVNIASMDVGRRGPGEAIMVLTLSRALSAVELQRIGSTPGIARVVQARLSV